MAEDYERLQKRIEDGLDAVRELKKIEAEQKRRERPKLRIIRGGLIWGAIWAGVEWLRNYKIGVALAATALGVGGVVIADKPHTPGGDPPSQAITQPAKPRSSVPPTSTPQAAVPSPRRTSPPRPGRPTPPLGVEAPKVEESTPKRTATKLPPLPPTSVPVMKPTVAPKTVPPSTAKPSGRPQLPVRKPPVKKPPVKTLPTPTVSVTVSVPIPTVVPVATCAVVEILDLCVLR